MNNKRRVVCIIQARMGSSRLPGKSMMKLGNKTLIEHVIKRAMQAHLVDKVVLATTKNDEDDILADIAEKISVDSFRGSTNDLMDRYYYAAKEHGADIVVRIPADNPLIMPYYIDKIIRYFKNEDLDFASNIGPYLDNKCPDGFGAEVFSFNALKHIYNTVFDKYHREHVTSVFRDNLGMYKVGTIECDLEHHRSDIILDINTQGEFDYMKKLFSEVENSDLYNIEKIISWVDNTSIHRQ